jgi:hypothetical protein
MAELNLVEPVLHIRPDDPEGVEKLATKVKNEGLYKFPIIFPSPRIPIDDFEPAVLLLINLNATAKGNTTLLHQRDQQSIKVHGMLKEDLLYVKPICIGNYELIGKSGFDPSFLPVAHGVAPTAVIKRIVRGPGMNTVKVMLEKAAGEEREIRESRIYTVYVFDVQTGALLRVGCSSTDSRKLLVPNVTFLTPFDYAVSIKNAAGENELSARMEFTLTKS